MQVKLYQCLSVIAKMNKESFLQNEIDVDCICRNPIDKTNPIFIFETTSITRDIVSNDNDVVTSDNNDVVNIIDNIDANYLYCVDWDRYYFIDNLVYNNNRLFTISCALDPLMTFKNSNSLNVPLYISRRTKGNKFIADNLEQFSFRKYIALSRGETFTEPTTDEGYKNFNLAFGDYAYTKDKYCIVVAVSNPVKIETQGGTFYEPDARNNGILPRLHEATSNSSMSMCHTLYYVITGEMLVHLCAHAISYPSIIGSILSITLLPYEIAVSGEQGHVMDFFPSQPLDFESLGFSSTCLRYAKYGNNDRFIFKKIHIPEATSYKDFEPHTTAELYIPYAETITLDLQKVRGCNLTLFYYVDFNTSQGFYELYNNTNACVVKTGSCQLGYRFVLTSSNADEIRTISDNNVTSFLFSGISSSLALMTGNPNAIIGTARGSIQNLSQFITRSNSNIGKTQATATASNTGSLMPLDTYIEWAFDVPTNIDDLFANNLGIPFNKFEYLSNIDDNEFVIVGDTSDITMSIGMTNDELNLLKNSLASGFYK